MPFKFSGLGKAYVLVDGEYKELGSVIEPFDLELSQNNEDAPVERYLSSFKPMEFTAKISNLKGLMIYLQTGNDLYLRFPKKLRRRRRRG